MHIDMKEAQELALRTWYIDDDNIDFDTQLQNAVMGLIGEAGEIVDVCKKISHKPGVTMDDMRDELIEELGDYYYFRIFCWLFDAKGLHYRISKRPLGKLAIDLISTSVWAVESHDALGYLDDNYTHDILTCIASIASKLNVTLDDLTQLNYEKLSGGKHGWPEHD